MKRLTIDGFIDRAKNVHGSKYDYSKVEYKNSQIKVCIVCPKHGEFYQKPNNHLKGDGCPKCRNEYTSLRCTLSTDEFIAKAKQVHGEKYDYSHSIYVNTRTPIEIICLIHGSFLQVPNYHLSGCGCPKCRYDSIVKHKMSKTKIYGMHSGMIERCRNKNHSKYNSYGGRGIKVCKEWKEFANFYKWAIANKYEEGLTLERIDVNGNYEPQNCKWIPRRMQYYNQRRTTFVNILGRQISLPELSDLTGITLNVLHYQYRKYGKDSIENYLKNKLPYFNEFIKGEK